MVVEQVYLAIKIYKDVIRLKKSRPQFFLSGNELYGEGSSYGLNLSCMSEVLVNPVSVLRCCQIEIGW